MDNLTAKTRVVIRPRTPIQVPAERTFLSPDGEAFDRSWEICVLLYFMEDMSGRKIVHMSGGPAGNEAFELTPENVEMLQTHAWVASRGSRGGADRVVVPARSLATFFVAHGIEVANGAAA